VLIRVVPLGFEIPVAGQIAGVVAGGLLGGYQLGTALGGEARGLELSDAVWNLTHSQSDDGAGKPREGEAGGPGAGKDFSRGAKDRIRERDDNKCVFCEKETTREPGPDQSNIDHAQSKKNGGNNTDNNGQNTCRTCNLDKGAKNTSDYLDHLKNQE